MTIQDWGALGEMISGFAIIVSLIYVAAQIRQNTKAITVSTSHACLDLHVGIISPIMVEKEFRDIYWRGLKGLSRLQGAETAAFAVWAINTFRIWETFWFQWQDGVFDSHTWKGWERQFADLFAYPGIKEVWLIRKHQLSDEYCNWVEQHVAGASSKPLYVTQEGIES